MTETVESKLDELIRTAEAAKKALNRRTIAFLVILAGIALMMYQLLDIAAVNKRNARIGAQNSELIKDATSPEAKAASDARLAQAIADIRRSQDCSGFYFHNERGYKACVEVDKRLDAIRAGLDPFARP